MTADEKTWEERDPDGQGIWWSDEENQFVCEATILSALPFDLLEQHPTDEASYWNLFYPLLPTFPQYRQKAFCKDIILRLGNTAKVMPKDIFAIPSKLHEGFVGYSEPTFTEHYHFAPSTIGHYIGVDSYLRNPKTKHIVESSIVIEGNGPFWTHYNPFELILMNPDVSKVNRPKLGRRVHHQMMILGNHQGLFGSCFMSHEQILSHVTSLLHTDVIDKQIPITDTDFVS